jgi:signal transduction histidine kinase
MATTARIGHQLGGRSSLPKAVVARQTAAEVKHLKACINDLMVVLALPAIWSGGEPYQIACTLVDALLGMLRLDLIYLRLKDAAGEAPVEVVRVPRSHKLVVRPQELGEVFNRSLGDDPHKWPPLVRNRIGNLDISIVPVRLGIHGEMGAIVAGSRRRGFPRETERLLLSVAANQAAIGLQEARLLRQQKRVADELDQRVAQRTAELAAVNDELRMEIAERRLAVERLRLEHGELKRSEALLAETQRLSSTGSFTWRVMTDEIVWSDQSYRIFQVDRATPITFELMANRVHPEDLPAFEQQLERARRDGSDARLNFRLQLPDGQIKHLHVLAHRIQEESGEEEIVGALMDVTESREAQAALQAAQSALAHAGRVATLAEIGATIAHEVNQPLAAIVASAEAGVRWLSRDVPNIAKVGQLTKQIASDARRASDIVHRIRAMATKHAPERVPVDLNEVVGEAVLFARHELESKSINLSVKLNAELPIVLGDRIQLQQVIVNLLVNSIQAITQSEAPMRGINLGTRADSDAISFWIRDSGPGIAEEDLEHIFESFFTTKKGGMGIGLAICQSIITGHGGNISVSNHPEGGAHFRFTLPSMHSSRMGEK